MFVMYEAGIDLKSYNQVAKKQSSDGRTETPHLRG